MPARERLNAAYFQGSVIVAALIGSESGATLFEAIPEVQFSLKPTACVKVTASPFRGFGNGAARRTMARIS